MLGAADAELGLQLLLGILAALVVMVIPGLVVAWVGRVGWRTAAIAAVPLSLSIIAIAGVVAPWVGVPWGWAAVGMVALAALLVAGLSRLLPEPRVPGGSRWSGAPWLSVVGVLIGGGMFSFRFLQAIGSPDATSQSYDAPFHLNLVRSILERADGSSLHVDIFALGNPTGFYPAAWHDVVSLIVQGTGIQITVAATALTVVLTGIVWPLGVGLLLGTITRSWRWAGVGALLSCSLAHMPAIMTWFGILYPNLLAYMLLPFLFALLQQLLFPARRPGGPGTAEIPVVAVLIASIPGLVLAHPSGAFSLFYLSFPMVTLAVIQRVARWARHSGKSVTIMSIVAVVGTGIVYFVVDRATLLSLGISDMRRGPSLLVDPEGSWRRAALNALTLEAGLPHRGGDLPYIGVGVIGIVFVAIIALGAWRAWKIPQARWIPFAYVIALALYVISFSDVNHRLRKYIVGPWYGVGNRLAALIGVIAILLFVLGVGWIVQHLLGALAALDVPAPWRKAIGAAVVGAIILAGQLSVPQRDTFVEIYEQYGLDANDGTGWRLLSADEKELLQRIGDNVAPDEWVIGNPWTGASLTPAIGDRNFVFPHMADSPSWGSRYLAKHLREADSDPRVCEIVVERNIRFALDFGDAYLWDGRDAADRHHHYRGLEDLVQAGVARVVDEQGEARLLELTACDE